MDVARSDHRLGLLFPVDVAQTVTHSTRAVEDSPLARATLLCFASLHSKRSFPFKVLVFTNCLETSREEHFESFFGIRGGTKSPGHA